MGSVVPKSLPPGAESVTFPPLTLLIANPCPLEKPDAGNVIVIPEVKIKMFVPLSALPSVVELLITFCPLDRIPGLLDRSANDPDVATVANPDTSAAGTVAEAVNALVPLPLTYPVRVVAPVPPLATASVPLRVSVPLVVIGEPVKVRPVVPPDAATEVTVPLTLGGVTPKAFCKLFKLLSRLATIPSEATSDACVADINIAS